MPEVLARSAKKFSLEAKSGLVRTTARTLRDSCHQRTGVVELKALSHSLPVDKFGRGHSKLRNAEMQKH